MAAAQRVIDPVHGLLLGKFSGNASVTSQLSVGKGYQVDYPAPESLIAVLLPAGTSFSGRTHLDLRLTNRGNQTTILEVAASSGAGAGWMTSKLVISAGETLSVSVPFLFAENYGLRALPTLTDAVRFQPVSKGSILPSAMQNLFIWNKSDGPASILIETMEAASHTVPLANIIDTFGQQRAGKWTGKVLTVAELQQHRASDPVDEAYPYTADAYGGVAGGKNYGASNRFRLVKDGGRWFFVTPTGNRFFSAGVNEVGAHAWTPITGREGMFTNLSNLRAEFANHFTARDGRQGYIPYAINLQRKYGADWRTKAEAAFTKRMKAWGFNTLGVNSWDTMVKAKRLPSTFGGEVFGAHRRFHVYDGRSIHDIYDPLFETSVRRTIQERLMVTGGNHEASVGVFLDNEMPWGDRWRENEPRYRYGLAYGALLAPADQPARAAIVSQLKTKYVSIHALNIAWGSTFLDWPTLAGGNIVLPSSPTAEMKADLEAFVRDYATKYFSLVRQELRAQNYQGPYLGCRFTAGECPPEVLDVAKQFADVISFNVYHARPSSVIGYAKNIDHPIMISEFAFGANDLGRVGVPYYPTMTDSARMASIWEMERDIRSFPNLVGAHWYRWEDFPVTGKADFDNAALGLHSVADVPYLRFIQHYQWVNKSIMKMLRALG